MFDKNGFYQSERITKPEFFEKHTGLAVIAIAIIMILGCIL